MTWEEYQKQKAISSIMEAWFNNSHRKLTDIKCPKCGNPVYVRTDIVLATYPPKSQYECDCGWVGYC